MTNPRIPRIPDALGPHGEEIHNGKGLYVVDSAEVESRVGFLRDTQQPIATVGLMVEARKNLTDETSHLDLMMAAPDARVVAQMLLDAADSADKDLQRYIDRQEKQ